MGAPPAQARSDQLTPRRARGVESFDQQHRRTVLKPRLAPLAAIVTVAAFALAGCGGASSNATGANPGDGKQIFTDAGCASCHAFEPAGSSGGSGPDLDNISITEGQIEQQVKNGGGGMPSFGGQLTDQQITAVATFVASGK